MSRCADVTAAPRDAVTALGSANPDRATSTTTIGEGLSLFRGGQPPFRCKWDVLASRTDGLYERTADWSTAQMATVLLVTADQLVSLCNRWPPFRLGHLLPKGGNQWMFGHFTK